MGGTCLNRNIVILGASGHGHVIADIVTASGDTVLGFLDDDPSKDVLGKISDYANFDNVEFVVGIGSIDVRKRLSQLPLKWYTAIHPSAIISPSVRIGEGTVVMPNAVINSQSRIGKHCIINSGSIVEHDSEIGDYSHISVGAKLGGTVNIGKEVWIGIGSTISNNISVCDKCIIGAGAVVVKSITEKGTYIGVPAKRKL